MRTDTAEPFRQMADRITHNIGATFGGACVIVPPGETTPIEMYVLDSAQDPGQFWSTLKTRIEMAILEIDTKKRMEMGYGRR
jgi:hypothetical protein